MAWICTTAESYTGKFLYSDAYAGYVKGKDVEETPFLNEYAIKPFIGIVAGVARCGLAIIHSVGHLFAALVFRDAGHLGHSLKGGAEFVRGTIEALPIIGRIFAFLYDPAFQMMDFTLDEFDEYSDKEYANFFLVKIFNPLKTDKIDKVFSDKGMCPFIPFL